MLLAFVSVENIFLFLIHTLCLSYDDIYCMSYGDHVCSGSMIPQHFFFMLEIDAKK